MTFEEYWGKKGEKWNGKLDIKQFAKEVWETALNENKLDKEQLVRLFEETEGVRWDFNIQRWAMWTQVAKALEKTR